MNKKNKNSKETRSLKNNSITTNFIKDVHKILLWKVYKIE